MAITYPRSFPFDPAFARVNFKLVAVESNNRTRGGAVLGVELADAYWSAEFETGLINYKKRAVWQAWANTLRGLRTFYGFDPEKAYPIAYGSAVLALTRFGGGAFDGTCTVASSTTSAVTLSALPAGYQFKTGDHIMLPYSASRALHQVVEDTTANSSGVATGISVEPPIRSGVLTTALAASVVKPSCVMMVVPGSFDAPGSRALATVRFSAEQVQP